ncbi:hypothetical protein E4U14_005227 [Claviceps sp. LM454 group G7]|nr:hypothetical protein E4U14_005227 [Claviceps sp. LM454 group G7]
MAVMAVRASHVCIAGVGSGEYPKSSAASTTVDEDDFPTLARPDTGDTFVVRLNGQDCALDNRRTVSHTLYLLFKSRAHINVEVSGPIDVSASGALT